MDLNDKSLKLTPAKRKALEALGIEDTDALLSYYPFRYDILNTKPFSEWKKDEKVFFECRVEGILNTWGWGRKKNVKFSVSLEDHVFQVTIFNRPWAAQLKEGQIITVNGIYKGTDRITAISYDQKRMIDHDAITPVYSVKAGIQQRTIRDSIRNVYEAVQNEISDEIPEKYIRAYRLLRKQDALRRIHFPQTPEDIRKANRTLKYEEFLKYFTAILFSRFSSAYKILSEENSLSNLIVSFSLARLKLFPPAKM